MSDPSTTFRQLALSRYPKTKDHSLRAWNAADEYLCEWIDEQTIKPNSSALILNDQFGALSCCLSQFNRHIWTDSFLSKTAIKENLKSNSKDESSVTFVNQTDENIRTNQYFNLVVIRIPKHNSLLEFQLQTIKQYIDEDTVIVAGGMSKDIHKSNLKIFASNLGQTNTSLAKKKARLIFCNPESVILSNSTNKNLVSQFSVEKLNLNSIGMPGVFSRDSLDIGSRVLLDYLPKTEGSQKLIDLGCGTGILGTAVALKNPELAVTFTDESWLATESAKRTFELNCGVENHQVSYKTTDVLSGISDNNYDFVLCNPPFHQQNVQTLSIANKMFKESANKLSKDGELRVVANRHLKYRPVLSSYFNQVDIISNDPKFVVWLAKGPKK